MGSEPSTLERPTSQAVRLDQHLKEEEEHEDNYQWIFIYKK